MYLDLFCLPPKNMHKNIEWNHCAENLFDGWEVEVEGLKINVTSWAPTVAHVKKQIFIFYRWRPWARRSRKVTATWACSSSFLCGASWPSLPPSSTPSDPPHKRSREEKWDRKFQLKWVAHRLLIPLYMCLIFKTCWVWALNLECQIVKTMAPKYNFKIFHCHKGPRA